MKNASHSNLFNLDTFEWQLPVKYTDSHSSQMHYIIYWQRGTPVYYGLFSRKLPLQFANTQKYDEGQQYGSRYQGHSIKVSGNPSFF